MALRVTGILSLDGTGFSQGLNRAESAVNRFGRTAVSSMGTRLAGLFSIGATGAFVRNVVNYAGRLNDLADRTGRNVEELQRLDRAAIDNGTTLETIVGFWERIAAARQAALNSPTGSQSAAFKALGVSGAQLTSAAPADIAKTIAQQFQNTTNVDQLIQPLRDIGGRGAGALVGALRVGLDAMYQDITVMSSATAETLDDLSDSFDGFNKELMSAFAPMLVKVLNGVKAIWDKLSALFTGLAVVIGGNYDQSKSPLQVFGETAGGELMQSEMDRAEEEKARSARRAARRNQGKLEFSPIEKPDKITERAIFSHPNTTGMIGVGNFLGASRNVLESVGKQQLNWLIRIERNTKKIADKDNSESIEFPE